MQLVPRSGPQAGNPNLVYGFHPAGANYFGGAGRVRDDGSRPWDWRICFTVTAAQYNAMAAGINSKVVAPPPYCLVNFNCTDWITQKASLAGIALPVKINMVGIADPEAFWQSLDALGNGGVFGGGTVNSNATGLGADGGPLAAVFSRNFGYEELSFRGSRFHFGPFSRRSIQL